MTLATEAQILEVIQNRSRKDAWGLKIEQIWAQLETQIEDLDKGQVVVTMVKMMEAGTIENEIRSLRVGGPDGEKQDIPIFRTPLA